MSPPDSPPPSPPLTYELISRHFHLPVSTAASLLGVSRPTISKVLRAEGVQRWPYRAVRAHTRRVDNARAQGKPPPPLLDSPRTAARKKGEWKRQCVKKEEEKVETYDEEAEEDEEEYEEQEDYDDEEEETYVFQSLHPPRVSLSHPAAAEDGCHTPAGNRCYTADSSYPSTAPSDFLPAPLPALRFVTPHCAPAPASDNDWRCSETLDPSCTGTSPQRPSTAGSSPPRARERESDGGASHTVSTMGTGEGEGGVHRVLFGAPNWSRGIFSPDAKTGAMSFRFLGNEASEESADRVGSSLSITESELYNAVGSQIEVLEQGVMQASGESAEAEVDL